MRSVLIFNYLVIFFSFSVYAHQIKKTSSVHVSKDTTTYYVLATNGLNYRDKPWGKVLGKFKPLTKVKIVERTGNFSTIKVNSNPVEGEWVGIKTTKKSEKVYVFDGFLVQRKKRDASKIYDFQSYHIKKPEQYFGFIPLTDDASLYEYKTGEIIRKEFLGKNEAKRNTITGNYRKIFLFQLGIRETDFIYIYRYFNNQILKIQVKELAIIADPNPYGVSDDIDAGEYIIGFSLRGKIAAKETGAYYRSLVAIGSQNPFQKGGLKPLIWKRVDKNKYSKETVEIITSLEKNKEGTADVFEFHYNKYTYFLRVDKNKRRYFQDPSITIVFDGKVVKTLMMGGGEGSSPTPLTFGDSKQYLMQWTGILLKNRNPVIFGLSFQSFGCEGIHFLNEKEKSMYVLCDNRH